MSRLVRCAVVSVGLCVALLSSRVFDFGHQDTMSRLLSPQAASAQGDSDASSKESAEDARDRRIMERFLLLLKRQPRFGTALDRVYGHHIERGTIDDFVQSLKDAVTENAEDGTTWLILGLIEMQRGRDIEAVEALQQAETHRPDDPLASYYLGRTLVLVGKPSQAAEAFERAIERKPLRADLLEIYQALGRAHQRAQRTEEALAVWDRLEQQFPDDLRVQEQIATILEDEEDYAGALKRYQSLQSKSKDAYRKVQYGIKAAELKIQTGKKDDAIADFEGLLADLKPDSWLHRDVRQRIEAVFLRADDYAGLSTYYERWLKTHQDDIDAMSRLGRTLSLQGRLPEAKPWYDKAVKLAPSNRSLRKSYIDQLIQGKQFAAAVEQYEQLDKLDPGNPDNIREWGQLILEDKNTPEADRKKLASDVWRRLLEARPEDAVIASQVADLFRHAKMTEPAIELYRKAIELAPNDPQYREYLGEYYHSLERKDDAVETWQVIAAGKNRNTRNLIRLAEVYHGFGYREQAVEAMGEAMKLDPEFADRVRYGQMLRDTEQYDESLAEFDTADSLTEDSEERQLVLNERIKTLQLADRMAATIEELEAELGDKPTIEQWQTLARYYQADRRIASAAESVKQALAIDEDDVQSWKVAAEIYESGGMIADAVAANRKLTTLDRRYRTEHLTKIATLEMRLGRVDEALEAGRELLAAAPGNPEHYRFFADLNFQSGRSDEGLDALRRAVRVNPADTSVLIALASALADQFRTSEAIELYWRAFDKAEDLDGQISVVNTMTELYLRTNHFDRLVDKLERLGRELDAERDMALCLAAAHRASGDFGTARETLEELLDEETRDTQLLAQLVQLAEAENDYELAARYQRQINELAPSRDNKQALAGLLVRTGDAEEAEKLWMELSEGEREPHRIIDGIDSMITNDKFDAALQLVDKRLRDNPRDWEAHLRAAIAHWKADRKDEAAKSLHALLDINLPPDTLSAKAEHLKSQAKKTSAGQSGHGHSHASARSAAMQNYPRVLMRSQAIYQVTRLLQLNPNYGNSQAAWSPNDFGEARIAALAVLHNYATTKGNADEFLKELEEKADPDATRISSATWDWYFLNQMVQQQTQNYAKSYELAKRMSYSRDPAAMLMYLSTLRMRNYKPGVNYRTQADFLKGATPLSDEELKHVKECYAAINAQYPSWSGMSGGVMVLVNELKLAKREEEADKLYAETLENASDPQAISILMQMAGSLGKMDDMMMLVRKLRSLPQSRSVSGQSFVTNSYYQWGQMMAQLSGKEEFDKVRELLDVTLEDLAEKFAATPSHRRGASSTQSRSRVYAQVYQANGSSRGQQLDYPQPNAFFDNGGIILLYNAWHQHQEAELSDEFLGYLDAKAANADQKLAPIARLALAYVSWWSDDKSESMRQLQFAQKAAPDVLELRLELAGLYQQQGQQQEALRLLEEIEPSNHNILRSRELLALNVSVSVGDIERARKAAERLFGLQLDTNLQLQLAQQMHQLGMHEMAEGVLARLRRRSGGQTSTLVQLMNQYRNQGKKDIATQIANQILRRTKPNPSSSRRTSEDSYRQQAVQVLAASGQLDEIIGRVKAQLKKSPKSVRLHEILADYYRAAGKNDEARAIVEKITDLRPDDAKHLYSLAQQLYRSRDYKASCDTYLKAIRIDPSVMGNDFYNVQNAFRREKRMEELGRVMLDIDLKSFSQRYYYMSQFYSQLMRDEATRQLGIDLFKKSWEAFPQYRHYLIGQIYTDEVWQLDEMYDYARLAMIPQKGTSLSDPWMGAASSMSYSGDGSVTGPITRLFRAIKDSPDRQKALRQESLDALKENEHWLGGKAILAILDAQAGNKDACRKLVDEIVKSDQFSANSNAGMLVGQEFTRIDGYDDVALSIYAAAVEKMDHRNVQFSYSPGRQLARLYANVGRPQDARNTIHELLKKQDFSNFAGNPGYREYQELQNFEAAAKDMLAMNMPLDAVAFYNRALNDESRFDAASRYGGSNFRKRFTDGKDKAMAAITPDTMKIALDGWIQIPDQDEGADNTKGDPAVELLVSVEPQQLDQARVTSLFQMAVSELRKGDGGRETTETLTRQLADLRTRRDDVSVRIAEVILTLAEDDAGDRQLAAVSGLDAWLSDHPVPAADDDRTLTPKEQKALELEVALWLVARVALTADDSELQALGTRIGDRAIQAARSHRESIWLMAMLRERGELALKAGDREAAEEYWSQMLDRIIAPPISKKSVPRKTTALPAARATRGAAAVAAP